MRILPLIIRQQRAEQRAALEQQPGAVHQHLRRPGIEWLVRPAGSVRPNSTSSPPAYQTRSEVNRP